jgi:monofunctional biosynthetic peptidoglycan transglycosylase
MTISYLFLSGSGSIGDLLVYQRATPDRRGGIEALLRRILRWIKRGAQALLVGTVLTGAWILLGLPWRSAVRNLAHQVPDETTVMRQREDEARAAGRKPRHLQKTVPLRSISKNLIHAVLSAEDPNFFGHEGIDWDAIKESIETNIEKGRYARGGSTITQQLAKNLFFTTRKSLIRKAREAIVAIWMEHDLPKKRIIEVYLNVIEWGDGVYGCEAAARRYYGSSCAALSVEQAAGLAAMIPSPRRINPRTNPGLHARATRRVLSKMRWAGYLKRDIRDMGKEPEKILVGEAEAGPEPQEQDDPPVPSASPAPTPTPNSTPTPIEGLVSGTRSRLGLSRVSMIEFPW